ncbi:hypothetical protein WCIBmN4_04590 [Wolbachia pipientis]
MGKPIKKLGQAGYVCYYANGVNARIEKGRKSYGSIKPHLYKKPYI